jgi:hypothetical protein
MPNVADVFYTAVLPHPTDPGDPILELDVKFQCEWVDGYESKFSIWDIYAVREVNRNGIRWLRGYNLPWHVTEWVRECIETDRESIVKAISNRWEGDVVSVPRADGGRLTLAEPF